MASDCSRDEGGIRASQQGGIVPSRAVAQCNRGKKDFSAKPCCGCLKSRNIGYSLLVGHNGVDPQFGCV
jgi:hypothetical protein